MQYVLLENIQDRGWPRLAEVKISSWFVPQKCMLNWTKVDNIFLWFKYCLSNEKKDRNWKLCTEKPQLNKMYSWRPVPWSVRNTCTYRPFTSSFNLNHNSCSVSRDWLSYNANNNMNNNNVYHNAELHFYEYTSFYLPHGAQCIYYCDGNLQWYLLFKVQMCYSSQTSGEFSCWIWIGKDFQKLEFILTPIRIDQSNFKEVLNKK